MEQRDPWLAAGDFNSVIAGDEVSNPVKLVKLKCSGFQEWVSDHSLVDLGFDGPTFTWTKGNDERNFQGARLDRDLCNMEWRSLFETAIVGHLPKLNSDHVPVLINLRGEPHLPLNLVFSSRQPG